MPYCDHCGMEIVIRRMGGRAIPIHVNGTCTASVSTSRPGYISHVSDSLCRLTKCPKCRDPVLFIRHNGGSVWIDPPPGPPWTKHDKCFPTEIGSGASIAEDSYLRGANGASDKSIAVVTKVEVHPGGTHTILHLQYEDGSLEVVRVAGVAELHGELVFHEHARKQIRFWKSRSQVYDII